MLLALVVAPLAGAKLSARDASLVRALGPQVRISLERSTGRVSFLGTPAGRPIARPAGLPATATPSAIARAFLARAGSLFGIDQARDLRVTQTHAASHGRHVVRFQQLYLGVPVLAGELVVNEDASGNILSANGEALPSSASLSARPVTTAGAARARALAAIGKLDRLAASELAVSKPQLWVYSRALLGGPGPGSPQLVWRMDVNAKHRSDIRELVLVDARTGRLLLHFNQIERARNRVVCDAANTSGKVPCTAPYARTEGGAASSVADVNQAYDNAGLVYAFYKNNFNRDSIDGKGMTLIQTVRYCDPSTCPGQFANAFWNGSQMVYGKGLASADDVVGHEMTHGVTERTSNLFYWFQSGAINESMSDTIGEFIDLTDGVGNDNAAVRWQISEDLPVISGLACGLTDQNGAEDGALRDMKTPGNCGQPDSMTSPDYLSSTDDNGGVHTNSGVGNKAAYLMTDGGTFGGKTVTGLGIAKAEQIYYETDTNILTSGSDYADLANALYQACQNLVGTHGITATNCTQATNAAAAVKMSAQPTTGADVQDAPMCGTGQIPTDLFYDNMEGSFGTKWTKLTGVGTNPWAFDHDYATSGQYALYAADQTTRADVSAAQKTAVALPAGQTIYARFAQADNFESGYDSSFNYWNYDGGVVEYSANGGSWTDAGPLFVDNPYFVTIAPSSVSDNPLAGRRAFGGTSGGYFTSRLNLSSLAGDTFRMRFREGTDTGNVSGGFFGWPIDDVRIYTCATGTRPGPTTANKLRNPGFEWDDNDDGYPDVWSENTGALRWPYLKHAGKESVRLKAADFGAFSIGQKVAGLTAGASYVTSGWVDIPTTTSAVNFSVQVKWLNSANGVISTITVKNYTASTAGWDQATATLVAPAGTVAARVVLLQNAASSAAYADDFNFHAG